MLFRSGSSALRGLLTGIRFDETDTLGDQITWLDSEVLGRHRSRSTCSPRSMIEAMKLRQAILDLGLEDWIPLPEIPGIEEIRVKEALRWRTLALR